MPALQGEALLVALPKVGKILLPPADYAILKQHVLARDQWRCRRCRRRSNLHVHHLIKRSRVRIDADWNLCTLCNDCHELVERSSVRILGDNANELLVFRENV